MTRSPTITDIQAAAGRLSGRALRTLADTSGIQIGEADKKELPEKFSTMPPHPEMSAALRTTGHHDTHRIYR